MRTDPERQPPIVGRRLIAFRKQTLRREPLRPENYSYLCGALVVWACRTSSHYQSHKRHDHAAQDLSNSFRHIKPFHDWWNSIARVSVSQRSALHAVSRWDWIPERRTQ